MEVDKNKIEVISKLPLSNSVRAIRIFLNHDGLYRRFKIDFSLIVRLLNNLLRKDILFVFDDKCMNAFNKLMELLATASIMTLPNWSLPFEWMCDASDHAIVVVLGQRHDTKFHVIYYASNTLIDAQVNYTTTEKELLVVVYALDNFRSYLVLSKTIIYIDHSALIYMFNITDVKSKRII